MTAAAQLLEVRALRKSYARPSGALHVLSDVTLDVGPGDFVVVEGRSGSGKSTLLNLLSGLDRPSSGSVTLWGRDLAAATDDELSRIRCTQLGIIFQNFGLLPMLSAAENIEIPLRIAGTDPDERRNRVADALELVGLIKQKRQRPAELSGGQQQRVGIARAIVHRPGLLLADEPTAQLDTGTAGEIIALLGDLVDTRGMAVVLTTHQASTVRRPGAREMRLGEGTLQTAQR